jgi:competence protein ComEC
MAQIIFCGLALGIIFQKVFNFNFWLILLSVINLVFLLFLFKKKKIFFSCIIFFTLILCGFLQSIFLQKETTILLEPTKEYQFIGQIVAEPDRREFNQKIILQPENLKEKILISASLSKNLEYGDKISIKGKLKKPENFESEQGIEFDYINFLQKEEIFYQMSFAQIEIIESRNSFFKKLFWLKTIFMSSINKIVPSPEAELVGGILLGLKSSLGKELEIDFRRVGLIHIVVLSGYNITIIAVAILAILFFLPINFRLATGMVAIGLFAVLVGGGATVIRACIMSIIAILAKLFHQNYDVNKALFLAGFIMIFINPDILVYDPSFQLSFLATFGLINFSEKIKNFLKIMPEKFGLKEIVVATIATQIAVFPLLAKMMGEISVVSLIVNVIVLPTIPLAMLLGFLTGIFGLINHFTENINFISEIIFFITIFFGFLTKIILGYVIFITEFFSQISFATINLPKISWLQIVLIYCLIIASFNYSPIQISKKIFNILRFATRKIIRDKRMFPHI